MGDRGLPAQQAAHQDGGEEKLAMFDGDRLCWQSRRAVGTQTRGEECCSHIRGRGLTGVSLLWAAKGRQ